MKRNKKGQISLIVMLVLVVMLTVGLAVISRTITQIKVSEHEKEAVRAFSAAEAGIEQVLKDVALYAGKTNEPIDVVGVGGAKITTYVTVSEISNNVETEVKKNASTKVDLNGANSSLTTLTIQWVKNNDDENPQGDCSESSTPASLEIIVYNKNGLNYSTRRYAYNACGTLTNGFESSNPPVENGDSGFLKKVNITVDTEADLTSAQDMLVSIRVLYNKTTVRIVGNVDLPLQQYRITSRAVGTGGEAKAVEVSRTISALPEIFDYGLFSEGSLVK